MKSYKFQALITLYADHAGAPELDSAPRRMVLRGRNGETGRSQVYTALVSCDEDKPFRPNSRRVLATLRLAGDDVADYVGVGEHFDLWLGDNIGEGVITRKLFV